MVDIIESDFPAEFIGGYALAKLGKDLDGRKGSNTWRSDKHATEPTEPMILLPSAGLVASGVDRPRIRRFWKLIHEGKKKIGLGRLF